MTSTVSQIVERLRRDGHGPVLRGSEVAIADVTHDHRRVAPASLFCAIPGTQHDGHEFAADAVASGATALLVERWLPYDVVQIKVDSTRRAMASAAACVHADPSSALTLFGVTGTNGKTTVTYLVEGAIAAAGKGVGVVGTVEARIHGRRIATDHTTPESTDLQRLLATMRDQGADAVVMEVSSHGLDLSRVDALAFDVAVFTNLSQDHLDWHGSMEAYFAAKQRLFEASRTTRAVVNVDDEWGRRLVDLVDSEHLVQVTTVGRSASAQVRIVDAQTGPTGSVARLDSPWGRHTLHVLLAGEFNLVNAALAFAAAVAGGIDPDAACTGIAATRSVPGRLERVETIESVDDRFPVYVDYAHTPAALDAVIATLRATVIGGDGRVIVVAGAGGDRDRDKRYAMGAALALADVVVLTSDNPRSEDPMVIIEALRAGVVSRSDRQPATYCVVDRAAAIDTAVRMAAAGDVVLIAGKGHETTQQFADHTVTFDDRDVARAALTNRSVDAPELQGEITNRRGRSGVGAPAGSGNRDDQR